MIYALAALLLGLGVAIYAIVTTFGWSMVALLAAAMALSILLLETDAAPSRDDHDH